MARNNQATHSSFANKETRVWKTFGLLAHILPSKMSVLRDRSNFNNIIEGTRHARTPDDNIFVSFSRPRAAGAEQTRRAQATRTPPIIRLFSEISNNEDLMNSSDSFEEEFGGLPSVLLTPTSPNDAKCSKFNIMDSSSSERPKKKLRIDNQGSQNRLSLQNKLHGLTKTQLINLLENLVCDRHPELEEVSVRILSAQLKSVSYLQDFMRTSSFVPSSRSTLISVVVWLVMILSHYCPYRRFNSWFLNLIYKLWRLN